MNKNIMILLDNGHGKETPGKRSPVWKDGTQLFEWEYNRKVVDGIIKKLDEIGIKSVKLVPEDKDISLSERAARANKICQNNTCILISVHCNAGGGTGWEVFSTTKKNNSDKLANTFIEVYKESFPDKKCRGHKESDFTVIYKSNCPSVLTENFFMDTESDCKFLMSDEGFNRIVDLHVNAIMKYIQEYM
jgi:N-acetylmuramoyl-L-alanine amidase